MGSLQSRIFSLCSRAQKVNAIHRTTGQICAGLTKEVVEASQGQGLSLEVLQACERSDLRLMGVEDRASVGPQLVQPTAQHPVM